MTYIVFDKKGIIHESNNQEEAQQEFDDTTDFEGDLIFAKEISRRR